MCRGAMLGSRARHAAAADATTVRLPSSEGLFFASRARHAAAAKDATDPFELYRGLGQRLGRATAQKALRSAPNVRVFSGARQLTRVNATTRGR